MSLSSSAPKVSVITASWNQGRFIGDCIDSIRAAAIGSVEHIIIDNCSDDETHTVIRESPWTTAVIEPDKGQSDAFNKGVALARSEWVLWLNADDYMLPGALAGLVSQITKAPSANIIYGHTQFVDEQGQDLRPLYQVKWHYLMIYFGLAVIPTSGTLIKRSLISKFPLDTEFHIVMDSEWCLRSGKRFKISTIPLKTVAFRVTDDNKTSLSIRTGKLTPKHAKERKILSAKYPFYGRKTEKKRKWCSAASVWVARKAIRGYTLVAKSVCMLGLKKSLNGG